jgi:hypothetical protein
MRALAIALTLAAIVALATPPAAARSAASSYRCDRGLVVVGDSIASVYKVCGQPSRTVQLETGAGGAAGERLEYFFDRKVVMFIVRGGRVARIDVAG